MKRKFLNIRNISLLFSAFFISFLFVHGEVQAALEGNFQESLEEAGRAATFIPETEEKAKVPDTKIEQIVGTIIGFLLGFISVIFFVLIFIAGFMWMQAGGNEEKIGKAKKLMISSAFAFFIITAAYLLTFLITKILIVQTGFEYGTTLFR